MGIVEPIVYFLCLVTSCLCAGLLLAGYRKQRTTLLVWSALCFSLLALNNLLVVIDILFLPQIDLTPVRFLTALSAVAVLIYGFIWEIE
ncbi:MAG TPA: DUF5985 family protein [Stellaceae bacterium]|nr:DUF5985 family protein [Stellaceae bacterium]